MLRKPTLLDVARAAGVSYATADRVLNARGGVAEKSVQRVRHAISELGYERDLTAANLSRRRLYRFRLYLPQGDHSFFTVLRRAAEDERRRRSAGRVALEIREVPALDPEALAGALEAVEAGECDCIGLVAVETPRVQAALERLERLGIPVVTLVADMHAGPRAAYVGIDNVMAGRTAGRLMRIAHLARAGRVLPIVGSVTARDHRDRLEGAEAVLAETGITLLPVLAMQDRVERMREGLSALASERAGITGIYSIGAGNRALIEAIAAWPGPRPFVVLHDLTPATRAGLEKGLIDAVIDQKPAQEVGVALDVMRAISDGLTPDARALEITPSIYLKDNLPVAALARG